MKTEHEVRLALIGHIKQLFLDMNDPGDWTASEIEEADVQAEDFADWVLDSLNAKVEEIGDNNTFTLRCQMVDAKNFIDSKTAEPLVSDTNL
jgi:hypothetical protein